MGKENTCCFTGHRDIPADRLPVVSTKLRTEILQAISDGYTHFICGFASGASLIFAALVAEFKKGCPLVLEAAIPYPSRMNTPDATFQSLVTCCDVVNIHSGHYFGGCYMKRNRYMVDRSSRVIAVYAMRSSGGTASTVKYSYMQISDAGGDEGISRYLNEYDQHSWPYKHIIIDEGQDFAECHLELLYAIAEITDGCFYVFYDKNQLVQQRQTLEWVNRVECRLILSRNCRNTRSIAVTSYKPIGIEKIKMRLDIPGQKPTMYLSRNTEDAHQTIVSIIRNYTQQGIQKKQIVVLTVKTEDTSILSGISSVGGYPLVSNRNDNGILFTSSRKFKGLESDVVIVVDVDDSCFLDDEKRRVFYVGSSRAKHFLDIVSVMNDEDTNSMVVRLTGEKKKNAKLALGSFLKVKIVSGSTTS